MCVEAVYDGLIHLINEDGQDIPINLNVDLPKVNNNSVQFFEFRKSR